MNYYPFHVGDYSAHTGHLEPMEDLAYRRMLDAYYLREAPLPADPKEVARLIRMRQNHTEVEAVLCEFFDQTEDGWSHSRCDQEIDRMQDKQAKARASAAASVNARKAKVQPTYSEGIANVERTLNERSTDVELPTPTPTPTPITKREKKGASAMIVLPEGVSPEVWDSFVKQRKAKKAQITDNVMAAIGREASKAGWTIEAALNEIVVRNWQSFKAEWVQPKQSFAQQAADIARVTVAAPTGPDPALLKIEQDRQKAAPMPSHIRDQINQVLRKTA